MNGRRGVLPARFDPFHRRAQALSEMGAKGLFSVEIELRTEGAADFGRDDANLVLRHANHSGQQRAHEMRNLCGCVKRQRPFARVPRSDAPAGFDGHRREPLVNHALFDDSVCPLERGVEASVCHRPGERDVRPELGMRERRIFLERFFQVTDHRQRVVIHLDEIERVPGCIAINRHNHRHRMADEINAVAGEHGMFGNLRIRHR